MELTTDPECELLKDIFGLRTIKHPYLRCDECGEEYYKFRPRFCRNCGYAGGAIQNPSFSRIRDIVKHDIRYQYRYEIWKHVSSNEYNNNIYVSNKSKRTHPELLEIDNKVDAEYIELIKPYKLILNQNGPHGVIDRMKSYLRDNVHVFIEKPRILGLLLCALAESTDTSNLEKYNIFEKEQEN